jgi:PKD-like domain/Bacterial Ig-like domain (group 2)
MKKLFTLLIALFSFLSMSLGQTATTPILSVTKICISPPSTPLGVSFNFSGGVPSVVNTVQIQLGTNTFGTVISTTNYSFMADAFGDATINTTISLATPIPANTDGADRRVRIRNSASTVISPLSAQVDIRIQPTADAGSDLTACQSSTPTAITLGGVIGGGANSGAWTAFPNIGSFSIVGQTVSYATVTYTPQPGYTGSVVLTLTSNNPSSVANPTDCSAASDTRTITVNPEPTLTGVTATPACAGSNVTVTAAGLLPSTSGMLTYSINATPQTPISYTSSASGTFSFPVTGAVNSDIVEITNLDITTTTCSKSFSGITVTLVVNPNPVTAPLTGPTTACVGTLVTINSSLSTTTLANYIHSWLVTGSAISGLSLGTDGTTPLSFASFTPTTAGTVNVTYNVSDANGCTAAQQVAAVTVTAPPVAFTLAAIPANCDNPNFTLTAPTSPVQPSGTTGTWSVVPGSGTATILTPSGPTSAITLSTTTAVLQYTVSNGSCGTQFATVTLTNQMPRLSSTLTPTAICSGTTFSYTATGTPPGSAFSWTRAAMPGFILQGASSGGNVISETLTNTTNANVSVTYVFTVAAGICTAAIPENVIVTVKPKPNVTTSFTRAVCSGSNDVITPVNGTDGSIPIGTTYSWPAPVVTGGITGGTVGLPASLLTNINTGNLTNPTAAIQTATYTVTPSFGGCPGSTFTISVTVNPKPSIANILAAATTPACSGVAFAAVTPVNGLNGIVPSGTTYAWSAPSGSVTGGASGTGSSITGTLSNGSGVNQTATYAVTPTAGGCVGAAFTVAVTIKPTPGLTSLSTTSPSAICSGTAATYTPTGAPGATFAWNRAAILGITEPATGSIGAINEILHNTTVNPIVVTYNYIVTLNGCASAAIPVTVTVNPIPVLSSSLTAAACSGNLFSYTAASLTGGATFTWSRAAVVGITEAASSGVLPTVGEVLTNTTIAPIPVTYVFITTANGCVNTQNVVVTVNPKPAITPMTATICSGGSFTVTPQNVVDGAIPVGTTYSWGVPSYSAAGLSGGVASATTTESSVTGTLINSSRFIRIATYTVTPSFAGCVGTPFTVMVTVNPKPLLANLTTTICSGMSYTVTPLVAATLTNIVPVGTTYTWAAPSVPNISGTVAGASSSSITTGTLLNSTALPIIVTYVVTPTASVALGACVGASFNVDVTVNPTPVITGTLVVCEGGATTQLTATPLPALSTGAWAVTSGSATVDVNGLVTSGLAGSSVITYTAFNGCSSSVTVTVNSKPVIAAITTTTCAGSPGFALIPNPLIPGNIIPFGTMYSWSAPSVTVGLTGGVGGINASIISGTLANSTNTAGTATYTITPTANGCVGLPFTVTVTVDPKPAVTVAAQSICSGTAFTITPSNGANGIVPSGTTYTWVATPSVPGITGKVGGTNAGIFTTGTLLNSTTGPIVVAYSVTPTSGSCTGSAFTVSVTVNPTPVVTPPAMSTTCNGGMVTVALSGIIPGGTTYAWIGGTGLTFGPLSNLGAAPQIQNFSVTPTFGGCTGAAFNVPITVNPTPTVTGTLTICRGLTTQLTGSTAGSGTATPTWSSVGAATVNSTGLVTGVSAGSSVITYTDNNGCQKMVTVTINANPTVAITTTANFISQGCILTGVTATITGGAGGYSPLGWSSNPNTLVTFSGGVNVSASVKSTSINALSSPVVTVPTNVTINFEANDLNNCVTEAIPLVLTIYPALTASVSGPANLCIGATNAVTFTSGIAGGNAAGTGTGVPTVRTIVWASNSPNATVNPTTGLVTGVTAGTATISVTVTDASGCSATSSQAVTIKAAPALTPVITNVSCLGSGNGIICLTGQLPATVYTYAWSNIPSSVSCNPGLVPGTYAVTITDNSIACPQVISTGLVITEPSLVLSATIAGTAAVCQTTPAPLTFSGSGGTGAYTFTYTKNSVLQASVTTVSGSSITVSVPTPATGTFVYALVDVTSAACNAPASGSATITVDAALSPLPVVNAGLDQLGLLVTTATLSGSAVPALPTGLAGAWTVVTGAGTFSTASSPTSTVSGLPAGSTTLRWTISKGACKVSDDVIVSIAPMQLFLNAYLQGPSSPPSLLMNDDLRAPVLYLPTTSPYGGGETVNPSVFSAVPVVGDRIVDWIQVQLRTAPGTPLITKPALIQRDGDIVGLDGTSPVEINALSGNYHIALLHRNHLGVMSLIAVPLTIAGFNQFDFTDNVDPAYATYGTNAQTVIGSYRYMWAGDATGNGQIRYNGGGNDRSAILTLLSNNTAGSVNGYYNEDINMNGQVRYNGGGNDRSIILTNLGGNTAASITQQF